ncbi:hypothetical protein H4S08_004762 [Coemansia sp. RSA 1365]|nr:hypothetical protein H4S08_004762 [Coemansia sp. RSA 1365]
MDADSWFDKDDPVVVGLLETDSSENYSSEYGATNDDPDDLDYNPDEEAAWAKFEQDNQPPHDEIREVIVYQDQQALQNLPGPEAFIDTQQTDDDIMRWIEICQARDETPEADHTPDMNEVETMRYHNNVLERAVPSHLPGVQSHWVPVLPLRAATTFIRELHEELEHPGYARTLSYVNE